MKVKTIDAAKQLPVSNILISIDPFSDSRTLTTSIKRIIHHEKQRLKKNAVNRNKDILSVAAGSTDNPKVIQILLDNGAKIEDGNKLLDLLDKNEYIEKNQDYWDLRDRIYNEMNN